METENQKKKIIALLCIAAAAALWGLLGIFFYYLSAYGLARNEIVCLRTLIAALGLLAVILLKDRKKLRFRPRDIWMFFATGVVCLFTTNYLYFTSINLTSVSVAVVLLYTAPVFVVLLSALFFKERLTVLKCAALLLTIPGCAVVSGAFGETGGYPAAGILIGLASGLSYALYTVFSRLAIRKYDIFTINFYTFLFAAAASFLTIEPAHTAAVLKQPVVWPLVLGLGIVAGLMPFVLYTKGLACVGNGEASITATLEPGIATLLSVLVLGERMTWGKFFGIVLILGAVILIGFGERVREKREKLKTKTEQLS